MGDLLNFSARKPAPAPDSLQNMLPKKPDNHPDLFRAQLSQILNLHHPLVRLSEQMDWSGLEAKIDVQYSPGPGQPPLPTRLLVGLHYLKHAFDESDESVVARWLENPYWQYFCGYEHLQHEPPLHPTGLVRWRERMGSRLELLLEQTLETAMRQGLLTARELERADVDTTVQEKAVAFPTDARLYQKMRTALVREARKRGARLRQSYLRVGKAALLMQGRYARARQMRRAAAKTRELRTYLGRVLRDVSRKVPHPDAELAALLERAERLWRQRRGDTGKVYSVHAAEVECIARGKAHRRYEFGCKASFAATSKGNWIVSARSLPGNPYDGHTLAAALEQAEALTGRRPKHAYCDRGYRGHGVSGATQVHLAGRIPKGTSRAARRWMKRRAVIEPTIGHLKSDHRLGRNYLKGRRGDHANVVLAAAGYNLAKLLAGFSCVWRKIREIGSAELGLGIFFRIRPSCA